jgi:hypothetical protein
MAASAAAVIWLRPPWTEVPTSWHALHGAYSRAAAWSVQSALTAISVALAIVVIVGRGSLLDRLRYREESTRGAVRHLNELRAAPLELSLAAYRARADVVEAYERYNLIYRSVAKASDYTVTWAKDGSLDPSRPPPRPTWSRTQERSRRSEVAVDEAIDRVDVVLKELASSGLELSATRLLHPVISEALDVGVVYHGSLDALRIHLGAGSMRISWETNFTASVLRRKFVRDIVRGNRESPPRSSSTRTASVSHSRC